jgi:hypothetical protein
VDDLDELLEVIPTPGDHAVVVVEVAERLDRHAEMQRHFLGRVGQGHASVVAGGFLVDLDEDASAEHEGRIEC